MEGDSCVSLSPRPHVLFVPLPALGHINPSMELGKRLAVLGVRVTLVTSEHLHAKIGRAAQALSQPLDFTLVGVPGGVPPAFDMEDSLVEVVHKLAAQGHPVSCIVGDFYLGWITSLAHRTRLPEFVFWVNCGTVLAIISHEEALVSAGYVPFSSNVEGPDPMEVVTCIPGLPSQIIRYADLPFDGVKWDGVAEWMKAVTRHRFSHLPEAQGVLVNSFQALEPQVYKALTHQLQQQQKLPPRHSTPSSLLRFVGPLVSLAGEFSVASLWEEEAEECIEWLDGQPPSSVIFVSFGSIDTMRNIKQVQELARGLVASGQRFLWVLRKDAISSMEKVEFKDVLPDGFLEQTSHMGKVVRWAPQVKVLSHSSIGGFFSHCGWNSTLESINNGVPILGWPSFADQFTACRLLSHAWKMGLTLELNAKGEVTSNEVEKGVRQLMEGPHSKDMRACAIQLQRLSQEVGHNSCELLSFVDDICKHSSQLVV